MKICGLGFPCFFSVERSFERMVGGFRKLYLKCSVLFWAERSLVKGWYVAFRGCIWNFHSYSGLRGVFWQDGARLGVFLPKLCVFFN